MLRAIWPRWSRGPSVADPHLSGCPCLACQSKRWLTYRWPGDSPTPTLKITSYGGTVGGTGEPDRLYDSAVREADCERALSMVEDVFLRAVGYAAREVPPRGLVRMVRNNYPVRRADREVVRFLERKWSAHWYPMRAERLHQDPDETTFQTLSWLLDEVARSMSRTMGEEPREGALGTKPLKLEPAPPEMAAVRDG